VIQAGGCLNRRSLGAINSSRREGRTTAVPLHGLVAACGSPTTSTSSATASRTLPRAAYLHTIIGDVIEPERIDTYLDRGPEMLSFVHQELAAEDVLGARLLGLLPGHPRRPACRTIHRAKTVKRPQARCRHARPRDPVRQATLNVVVMQLRAVEPAQAPSARRAVQHQARRTDDVGQGNRQEPCRHGKRIDRSLADRLQKARVPVLLNTALTDLYVEDGVVHGTYVPTQCTGNR
jgi:3-oxosteroid 1-dehydrogenase